MQILAMAGGALEGGGMDERACADLRGPREGLLAEHFHFLALKIATGHLFTSQAQPCATLCA